MVFSSSYSGRNMASKGKRGMNDFDGDYVYRVLRKDENSKKDLKCKDNSANKEISEHIMNGSREKSQFISTTASKKKAESFAYNSVKSIINQLKS